MDDSLFIILIAAAVSLTILYFIIYGAVKAANDDLLKATQLQNILLSEYLKSKGIDPRIGRENMEEIRSLKSQKFHGQINQAELHKKLSEYPI